MGWVVKGLGHAVPSVLLALSVPGLQVSLGITSSVTVHVHLSIIIVVMEVCVPIVSWANA